MIMEHKDDFAGHVLMSLLKSKVKTSFMVSICRHKMTA